MATQNWPFFQIPPDVGRETEGLVVAWKICTGKTGHGF